MTLFTNTSLQNKLLTISGWLSLEEGLLLYRLAQRKCKTGPFVEIGSFQGKSTSFMASALKEEKTGKLYAIDPHKGEVHFKKKRFGSTYKVFQKNLKRLGLLSFVSPIKKTSERAHKSWKKPIALLFVDGLHEYTHVKKDLQIWVPHLKDKGIVACHDAFAPSSEVFRAVREELFNTDKFRYVSFANSIIYTVKGKPSNPIEFFRMKYNVWGILFLYWLWNTPVLPENLSTFLVTAFKKFIIKEKVFDDSKPFLAWL